MSPLLLIRIRRGAVIFGAVNLVRLIAERVMVGRTGGDTYTLLVIADVVLSILLFLGAWGLLNGRRWAPSTLLFSAGALFVSSAVLSVWMWPYFALSLESRSSDIVLGARLFFYALVLLACPYAAIVLLRHGEPSRGRLAAGLIGGMAAGGAFVAFLISRH